MLLGRAAEATRLLALFERARRGRSGVVVVSGEPGVGKTALIDFALRQGGGLRIRRVRAAEAERGLSFAGLSALLRPWESEIDDLPPVQAAALKGSLALGPAVTGDRFVIAAATLGLLTMVAERQPILLALDDFHWMDEASAEAVLFAARRLDCEGIAIILSTKVPIPQWESIELSGLDAAAAAELVAAHSGQSIAPEVAGRLVAGTAGNPLALIELARLLDPAMLAGTAPLPDPLPVGRATTALFAPRLAALDPGGRTALLLAALTDTDVDVIKRAAAGLGLADSAAAGLDHDGLVAFDAGRVVFAHPLIRSAVVEQATSAQIRAAHGALAAALADSACPERRAWHLAESVLGRDERVADELERMANGMRDKRAFHIASHTYERAAELSADRARYARCRFQAAGAAWLAGEFARARDLVSPAGIVGAEGDETAETKCVLGGIELFLGHTTRARRLLAESAAHYRPVDVEVAMRHQLDAVLAAYVGDDFAAAAELALETETWGCEHPALTGLARLLAGVGTLACGDPEHGARLLADAVDTPELMRGAGLHGRHAIHAGHELVRIGLPLAAKGILDPIVERMRAETELGTLPYALHVSAVAEARAGQLDAAYAAAEEAARLGLETGNPLWHYRGASVLAFVRALRGDETECRQAAAAARELGAAMGSTPGRYIAEALATLEFSLGNVDAALEHAMAVGDFQQCSSAVLLTSPVAVDIAEAHLKGIAELPPALAGALDRTLATEIAAELPGQTAGLARLHALSCADIDEGAKLFGYAVDCYTDAGLEFDSARTLLSWGEWLRRRGRPAAARTRLRAAWIALEAMGARLWAARALAELRATGAKNLPTAAPDAQPLTPQELQVALTVANGATNRETAGALFLSTKTVEMHLTQVYRKLGVRSRTELARRFAERGPAQHIR
ncbi:LuxR family transcriptional regulator [Nocardia sp. XZ_19_385]|uniref:LuxR family transcriptional regulator n=1 Tax=Nocardia sp. XZ_19_385 TaxID=2769488 RepID=UPI00188DE4B1|nr:LuxR family transcriptional regulator [Nocardia sp. XZ_19_385]